MARRTKEQLAQTRQNIIDAAQNLFATEGFGNTQISEIAEAASVGISSFYRQFKDKDDLLMELVSRLFEKIRSELAETRSGMDSSTPLAQIMTVHRTYEIVFRAFLDNPDLSLTMLQNGYGATANVSNLLWDSINGLVDDIVMDLTRAEEKGVINIDQKQEFGDAVIGMVIQLAHRMLVDGTSNPVEAAQFCTRITIGGFVTFVPAQTLEAVIPLLSALPWSNHARG